MIRFPQTQATITNALTGEEFTLIGLHEVDPSIGQLENITRICNEPAIYDSLFAPLFSGKPYPLESAQQWFEWATHGWNDNSHFAFGVIDQSGLIVAACDLKSADPTEIEFGYWASASHPGLITSAVQKMLTLAREAGLQGFFAKVKADNEKSIAVQTRLGFQPVGKSTNSPDHLIFRMPTSNPS